MNNNQWLMKYAGLTIQFLAGIAICVFIGSKTDKLLSLKTPLAIWILPQVFILSVIIKIVIDTGKKKP